MSLRCIYCLRRAASSGEHILQSCLGSWRQSYDIVCADCNGGFSGHNGIDTDLADCFGILRCLLWIFDGRGSGSPPPGVRRAAKAADGRALDLLPGGRFAFAETQQVIENSTFGISFGSASRALSRFPHLKRQYGNRLQDVSISTGVQRDEAISIPWVSMPGEHGMRAISKSCFNLLGTISPTLARDAMFDPLRRYVLEGTEAGRIGTWFDMISPLPFEIPIPAHGMAIFSSSSDQPALMAQVQLFGTLQFTAVLCENYQGPPVHSLFVANPWDRSMAASLVSGLHFDLVAATSVPRKVNIERASLAINGKLASAVNRVVDHTRLRENIIIGCQNAGLRKGDDMREKASEVAAQIANEVVSDVYGMSTSSIIDSAEEAARRESERESFLVQWARTAPWRAQGA